MRRRTTFLGHVGLIILLATLAQTLILAQAKPASSSVKPPAAPATPADPAAFWSAKPFIAPPPDRDGYITLDWYDISLWAYNPKENFDPTPAKADGTIPQGIRGLEGKKIKIDGNVIPLNFEDGRTTDFILNASVDACGFGATPRINEWARLTITNAPRRTFSRGEEVVVRGTFHVKEQVENGRVVGLYGIVAEEIK